LIDKKNSLKSRPEWTAFFLRGNKAVGGEWIPAISLSCDTIRVEKIQNPSCANSA
jgi:hypothetical protein